MAAIGEVSRKDLASFRLVGVAGDKTSPDVVTTTAVESWRELPDGEIEFTMNRLRSADLVGPAEGGDPISPT
jgi:hypothetical protein